MLHASLSLLGLWAGLAASAQEGGLVEWRGRDGFPKEAMSDAIQNKVPMMLYFCVEGSADCRKLSDGAFRNAEVVQATSGLACILFECAGGQHADVASRYGVKGYPTVIFCDPTGKAEEALRSIDPAQALAQIKAFGARYGGAPAAGAPAGNLQWSALRDRARADRRLIGIFFYDASPPSVTVEEGFKDPILKDVLRFFYIAKVRYEKGSPVAERFNLARAPALLILDPRLEHPEDKPIDTIVGSRSARELRRDLEAILAAVPAPTAAPPAAPGPSADSPKVPDENLSNDEIDHRFIQARITVAQAMIERGMKGQAIEVLEDVLKSYPKHVDTKLVRKMLEDLRK